MNPSSTNPSEIGSAEPLTSSHESNKSPLPNGLQALLSLSEGHSSQIKTALSPVFARSLVSSDPSDALKVLNNLAGSNISEIKVILKAHDCMKKLFLLLEHKDSDIGRQVCEILSKISARSSLLGFILENPLYLEKLMKIVSTENSQNRIEAAEVLFNATKCAHISQVIVLSEHGVLECLHALTKQEASKELYEFGRVGVLNCAKTYNQCVEGIFSNVSNALTPHKKRSGTKKTHLKKKR